MSKRDKQWDFFLAHSADDAHVAEQLYELLAPRARVFLDKRSLRYGDNWDFEIADAQRHSRITVVLISSRSETSYYEQEEIAAAIALARDETAEHRVVPVYLDGLPLAHSSVPYGLRLKHAITLSDRANLRFAAQELQTLLARLDSRFAEAPQSWGVASPLFDDEQTLRRFRELAEDELVKRRFVVGMGIPLPLAQRAIRLFPHLEQERILAVYDNQFDNTPEDCWVFSSDSICHFAKRNLDESVVRIRDLPDVTLDWTKKWLFKLGIVLIHDRARDEEYEWIFLGGGAEFARGMFDALREIQVSVASSRSRGVRP